MAENTENLYNDAMELAEISRLYIEDNMYSRAEENSDTIVDNIKAMSMITYMLTNIISYLLLNKACEKGEIPKEQLMESANALMGEIAKMQVYTHTNSDIKNILAKLDVLMLGVRKMIIN